MKKLIVIGAIMSFVFVSNAPSFAGLGVKAGLVRAKHNYTVTDVDVSNDYRSGVDVGLVYQVIGVPFLALLAEAHYVQKGMELTDVDVVGSTVTQVSTRLSYLSVPALAKVSMGGLYGLAGLRFDVLLSKDSDMGFLDAVYDDFSKFVTGYDIGVGFELAIFPVVKPLIELRYSGDLKDSYSSDTVSVNNRSLHVLVGLMF
jgi:opacity protein-like surface antigen